MHGSWLGMTLMVAVVIIGLVVSMVLTKNRVQRKAAVGAFVTLVLFLLLFYFVVIVNSFDWFLPVCALACVFVPSTVYLVILPKAARRPVSRTSSTRSTDSPKKAVSPVAAGVGVGVGRLRPRATRRGESLARQAANVGQPVMTKKKSEFDRGADLTVTPKKEVLSKEERSLEALDKKKVLPINSQEELGSHTTISSEPDLLLTPSTPDLTFDSTPYFVPDLAPDLTPDFAFEMFSEPEEAPFELVEISEAPIQGASAQEDRLSFEACFAKAEAFKEKGMLMVAVRLYSECAQIASGSTEKRKALFAEAAACVKAGAMDEAKKIAVSLRDDPSISLNSLEAVKLNAILRMS